MSEDQNSANSQVDLAKAFQELAKGEQTASALEASLSSLESKINDLLARAEMEQDSFKAAEKVDTSAANDTNGKTS